MLQYVKPTPVQLKNHPDFTEKWVQERIADDPSILGLGDVELRDVERIQPKAGRLDLLLRDPDSGKRYEVEIMLGAVNESHIIRTIEYWDIERKRYPQYDHCAVIVAEDITSRFLNVISLFNSAIPIIAIQLNASQVGEQIVLNFTKVLDEVILGLDDEEEPETPVDRAYWEIKASKQSLAIADDCLSVLREIKPSLNLKYNKYYIGITEDGSPNNFLVFRAKKQFLRVEAKISDQDKWKTDLEDAGLVVLEGVKKRPRIKLQVTAEDVGMHRELLKNLFLAAYQESGD